MIQRKPPITLQGVFYFKGPFGCYRPFTLWYRKGLLGFSNLNLEPILQRITKTLVSETAIFIKLSRECPSCRKEDYRQMKNF